MAESYFFVLG